MSKLSDKGDQENLLQCFQFLCKETAFICNINLKN